MKLLNILACPACGLNSLLGALLWHIDTAFREYRNGSAWLRLEMSTVKIEEKAKRMLSPIQVRFVCSAISPYDWLGCESGSYRGVCWWPHPGIE